MKLGIIYAGQGSQVVGMGKSFYPHPLFDEYPDLKELCFKGPFETLSLTQNTQPCMILVATIITDLLKENGIIPDYCAGLSLGEYSALYCAEVFEQKQVIELARFRGKVMNEAVQGLDSAMIAVIKMERVILEDLCKQASSLGTVSISNYNCPGQLVVSGERKAVEKVKELALEKGAKRVVPLNTSGPFHTALLKEASLALKDRFQQETFHEMKIPVVFNTLGHELKNQTIPEILEKQVMSPVYFEDSIRYMIDQGIDTIIEVGPGKVLSGFVKKIDKNIQLYQIEDDESLEKTIKALKGEDYEIRK